MPDVNEEDYLDNLLKSMTESQMPDEKREASSDEIEERKIKEQVQEALSKSDDKDVSVNAFDDSDTESSPIDWEEEKKSLEEEFQLEPEEVIKPEDIAKKAMEQASDLDVRDFTQDEILDDDAKLNDEELDDNINKMLEDIDVTDMESLDQSEFTAEDDSISEELSPSELERLVNMNLDDIIDDATSESISVDDLFADETKDKPNDNQENPNSNNAEEASPEESLLDQEEAFKNQLDDGEDLSAAEALGIHPDDHLEEKKNSKKLKNSKKKKSILTIIKNIFFETIEDENLENVEESSALNTPKDENEQLIDEVYGGKEHVDDVVAPQKGFFAKLKYRLQQRKIKNEEQNRLELEAEELEDQEKKKQKEEKKQTAKENKENKKKEKAAKPKKEKKPKAKKEKKPKKPKEPPKPGDILKIKPLSMVFFVLFIAGIIVLIQVMNMSMHHGNSVSKAKAYYTSGDYMKAYDSLTGISLNKSDQTLYEQSSTLMYVQRQYESYENYMKISMNTEAINALIKGIDRYNTYYPDAKELGVTNQMDSIKKTILDALQSSFHISETEANTLVTMMNNDFTKYYLTIEAYGEAK